MLRSRVRIPHCLSSLIVFTAGVAAFGGSSGVAFNTLDSGTDAIPCLEMVCIEDMHVAGESSLLETITIALAADGPGDTEITDIMVTIARDGGDGVPTLGPIGPPPPGGGPGPGPGPMTDDLPLFTTTVTGLEVANAGVLLVEIDARPFYTVLREGGLYYIGVQSTNPNVGHAFFGEPTSGETNDIVVVANMLGLMDMDAPGIGDPKLDGSLALGVRLDVTPLPARSPGGSVIGDVIDFEALEEGFQGESVEVDGVMFAEAVDGFPPNLPGMIAIDDGDEVWDDNPGMLGFVDGQTLGLNAFIGGPDGYSFPTLKSMRIATGNVHTAARMSIAYVVESDGMDFTESNIHLLAIRKGQLVAIETIQPGEVLGMSVAGTFTFGADEIILAGVEFDELILFGDGDGAFGGAQMTIDNVILGEAGASADLDGDGDVDGNDLLILLNAWGAANSPADLDGSGTVGGADLLILLNAWG